MSVSTSEQTTADSSIQRPHSLESARSIPVTLIDPNPHQPRHQLQNAEIEDLAASIGQSGILQPLLVRPNGSRFFLIAGYRRISAARLAGLTEVPCLVREMTDPEMLQFALIENLQRSDLNPIEEAEAINHLRENSKLDQKGIAELINKSEGFVSERTSLLKLPAEIRGLVEDGRLPIRKALEIGKLGKPGTRQRLVGQAERFGIDELREVVQKKLEKEKSGRKRYEKASMASDFRSILKDLPGVRIYKDRVSLAFNNEDELIATLRKLIEQLTSEI